MQMLPNELLSSIAAYLDWESARNLSLVNKQFYDLTLSRFYTSFRSDYPLKFLRTVALPAPYGQPAMTKQVKHVRWEPDCFKDVFGTDTETDEGITTSEKRDIARSYRHLNFAPISGTAEELPVDIAFTQHTTDHLLEAPCFFDLFLSFLPNIEFLEVHGVSEWDHCRYWFRYIAANASRFDKLKEVTISAVFRLEHITPLLTMPTLKELELSEVSDLEAGQGVCDWEMEDRRINVPERSSGIERLHILEAHVPTTSLAPFIGLFRALKTFTYVGSMRKFRRGRRGMPVVDYALLARALSAHSSTLQSFCLDQFESGVSLKLVVQITPMDPDAPTLSISLEDQALINLLDNEPGDAAMESCIDHLLPSGMRVLTLNLDEIGRWSNTISALVRNWGDNHQRICMWAKILARRGLEIVTVRHVAGEIDQQTEEEKDLWESVALALLKEGVRFKQIFEVGGEEEDDY